MAPPVPLSTIPTAESALQGSRAKMQVFLLKNPGSSLCAQVENLDLQASKAITALNGKALKVIGEEAVYGLATL